MSIELLYYLIFLFGFKDVPLGCTEDENALILNWPFFTIPEGKRIDYEEVCNYKSSFSVEGIEKISSLNESTKISKKNGMVIIEKETIPLKKFYSTENLTPYSGISLGSYNIEKDSKIDLYLDKVYGDGFFLLVLSSKDSIYARQIILGDIKCTARVEVSTDEYFEIPYRKKDFSGGVYEIRLYLMNYNKMKWVLQNMEIR